MKVWVRTLLVAAAALAGCTPPKPSYLFRASPLEPQHAVALTGDDIVGRGRPDEQWVDVATGRPVTERFPREGAMAVDGIGDEVKRYQRDERGGWHLVSVDSLVDDARSEFTPSLTIAPPRIAPGESLTSESRMLVVSLKDGAPRTAGPARRTIEHAGAMIAELPSGPAVVQMLRIRFDSTLTSAQAQHVAELYVMPGVGPVAERTSDTVRVFGLRLRESTHEFVRDIDGVAVRK